MAAIFTSSDGKQHHYVKRDRSPVSERESVAFGVADAKGRAVGMWRRVDLVQLQVLDERPELGGEIREVGAPLTWYEGRALSTRDGASFGSADVLVKCESAEQANAELDRRIERARKIALRKFGGAK